MKTTAGILLLLSLACCRNTEQKRSRMEAIIDSVRNAVKTPRNSFYPEGKLLSYDCLERKATTELQRDMYKYHSTNPLLKLREEEQAIEILEDFIRRHSQDQAATAKIARRWLALAYMRLGEKTNCITSHSAASCILPIQGSGIHRERTPSQKAKQIYEQVLADDPADMESRWLYNIVCMTLGDYPRGVVNAFLIPGLDPAATPAVKAFEDIAPELGLDIKNMAGGVIAEDFDNDGYVDLATSGWGLEEPMHLFHNNGDGTFQDRSAESGLAQITGGLNIQQTDYNNDGFKDIFVLRGGWKNEFGKEPNSLLKNNGDGTFTDVTIEAGLLSFHPTQTAAWNDFNNDGWLDVFIGNETQPGGRRSEIHRCELYMNNGDGTFTEIAKEAKCDIVSFVKGVTSGDYDNDGRQDIFISVLTGEKYLFRNVSSGKSVRFENTTIAAGLAHDGAKTFPAWFWDFDNDGWLDILACGYDYAQPLGFYAAAEALGKDTVSAKMFLYKNNRNGTFTNVAARAGLDKYVFAMGSNFGDIDNDGFLDFYCGTGNPSLQSVIPNKMYRNDRGIMFTDITALSRTGNLQKGHAVAFADFDNDGDEDIYEDMGGAYAGDAYQNSFFLNTGRPVNHWIAVTLEGAGANRAAIGARVKAVFTENGKRRRVFRDVNSGGSFGSSPMRREIGIGSALLIDTLEISWPGSNKHQVFTAVPAGKFFWIKQDSLLKTVPLKTFDWKLGAKLK